MNFRNMSAWAIRNPVTPLVMFAALLLAGLVSFSRMDINNNPDISFPMVSVTVIQPGAAPTELETQVTQRIEAASNVMFASAGDAEFDNLATLNLTLLNVLFGTVRSFFDRQMSDLLEGAIGDQIVSMFCSALEAARSHPR